MVKFGKLNQYITGILILSLIVGSSPFFLEKASASPGPVGNTTEATPIAAKGLLYTTLAMPVGCTPLVPTGGGYPCDPGVRYNTYSMLLSMIGIGPGQAQRQTYWNSIFYFAMRILLRELTMSIVNWINSGFQGNPSFVQDPKSFFEKDADRTIGNFIQNSDLDFLCEPFKINVKLSLGLQYSPFRDVIGCRLTDVLKNSKDAYTNFVNGSFINNGGWASWLNITTIPQNNQMGALLISQGKLETELDSQIKYRDNELQWGGGLLSFKECRRTAKDANQNEVNVEQFSGDAAYNLSWSGSTNIGYSTTSTKSIYSPESNDSNYIGSVTETCKITTPGSLLSDQMKKVTTLDLDALNMADDINEIVGALANFVITKTINKGFAAINKDELSPDDASWRSGISQAQQVVLNDINNVSNNPNYEPSPNYYVSDNGGIITNPYEQGAYNQADDQALTDAKTNMQNYLLAYKGPEQSFYDNNNLVYSAYSKLVDSYQSVAICYDSIINSPGNLTAEEISNAQTSYDTASTTVEQLNNIKTNMSQSLIISQNNLATIQNISNNVTTASNIDQVRTEANKFATVLMNLHSWTQNDSDLASSTLSTINNQKLEAESELTTCENISVY